MQYRNAKVTRKRKQHIKKENGRLRNNVIFGKSS